MEQTCISSKAILYTRLNGFNRAVTITLRNRIGSFANTRKRIAIHLQGSRRKELMNLKCLRITWGSRQPVLLPSHMLQVITPCNGFCSNICRGLKTTKGPVQHWHHRWPCRPNEALCVVPSPFYSMLIANFDFQASH